MAMKVGDNILEATRTPEPSGVVSQNRQASFIRRWRWPLIIILVVIVLIIIGVAVWPNHKANTPVSKNPVVTSYQNKLPSLRQAVQKNPNNAADHVAYAEALYVTGDKAAAKTQYIAAAKLSPADATIQNNLGNTYRDLGDTTAAVAAYKQAIKLAPTNQNAYVNLANLQIYTLHQPADGITTYQQAIKQIGATAQFELLLGLAYEQNGQVDKAKQTYQAILDNDPTDQAAKDNLARLQ
jgi:tetratricopeptide (TPR) repeat protein